MYSNGVAYLCGHLHTLFGLMRKMYTRHSNGMLELELGDWKISRMYVFVVVFIPKTSQISFEKNYI